ncbi:hypothetical protein GOODEAATRI_031151, partial [Goodea atripinnis]
YHMFGEDVHRLRVLLSPLSSQPDADVIVLFQKDGNYGNTWNYGQVTLNLTSEAMVSDITQKVYTSTSLTGHLSHHVTSAGLWTLHALQGQNIQLHFLDFDVEATYDMVEVRDGVGPNSTLMGPAHDLFSTSNQMTVWFFTDSGGYGRGFRANFTSGVDLGSPAAQFQCQMGACIHGNGQCDGVVNCPDGSDEADCGTSLVGNQSTGSANSQDFVSVCAERFPEQRHVDNC